MLKRHRLLTVPLVLAFAFAGLVVATQPATAGNVAGPYGKLYLRDVTVRGSQTCGKVEIKFVPAGVSNWRVAVSIRRPDSVSEPGFALTPDNPKRTLNFCPKTYPPGTYSVEGYLNGEKSGNHVSDGMTGYVTFRRIDAKPTALTVKVSRSRAEACPGFDARPKHCSKIAGRLTRAGKPWGWDWVQIQTYKRGKWVRDVEGRTNGLGKVTFWATISKRDARLKHRLHFTARDNAKASSSRTFKLPY